METIDETQKPGFKTLLSRGFKRTCPRCGKQTMFSKFIKLIDCNHCGEKLSEMRADDFPPYITMVIVGHIILPLLLIAERTYQPSITTHLALWLPLSAVLIYLCLPRVKGVVVGWMLHLGLRGTETQ